MRWPWVRPEPFTLGADYLDRVYCRTVDHARWAEQYSSVVKIFIYLRLHMTIGMIFYVLAAIVLFLAGIGITAIPNPLIWGLFCLVLGLLLDEYDLGFRRRR
jgi:hypothetical protein